MKDNRERPKGKLQWLHHSLRLLIKSFFNFYILLIYIGTLANGGISFLGAMELLAVFAASLALIGIMPASFAAVAVFFAFTSALVSLGTDANTAVKAIEARKENFLKKANSIKATFLLCLPRPQFFIPDFILKSLLFILRAVKRKPPRFLNTTELDKKNWLEITVGFIVMWVAPFAFGIEMFMGGIPIMHLLLLATSTTAGLLPFGFFLCSLLFIIAATQNYFLDVQRAKKWLHLGFFGIWKAIRIALQKNKKNGAGIVVRQRAFGERFFPIIFGWIVVLIGPMVAAGTLYWSMVTVFAGPWVLPVALIVSGAVAIENLCLETEASLLFLKKMGRSFDHYVKHIQKADGFKNTCLAILPSWQRFLPDALIKVIHFATGYPKSARALEKSWLRALLGPFVSLLAPLAYGFDAIWPTQMLVSGVFIALSLTGAVSFPLVLTVLCVLAFVIAALQCHSYEVTETLKKLDKIGKRMERFFRPKPTKKTDIESPATKCDDTSPLNSEAALLLSTEKVYHLLLSRNYENPHANHGGINTCQQVATTTTTPMTITDSFQKANKKRLHA